MKNKLLTIILAIIGCSFIITPVCTVSSAAPPANICEQTNVSNEIRAASGCTGGDIKATLPLPTIIGNIISAVLAILGVIAVIFIIIGGINYMTSNGDAGKVQKAKNTILYAVIGLIVCGLAGIITNFTINIINTQNQSCKDNETLVDGVCKPK